MSPYTYLCFYYGGTMIVERFISDVVETVKTNKLLVVVIAVMFLAVCFGPNKKISVEECDSKVKTEVDKVKQQHDLLYADWKHRMMLLEEKEKQLTKEIKLLEEMYASCSKDSTEYRDCVRENRKQESRYRDCIAEINSHRDNYKECKEMLDQKDRECVNDFYQMKMQRKDDQMDTLLKELEIERNNNRQLRHQAAVEDHEETLSQETHNRLDSLRQRLVTLARKQCKGWFSSGEPVYKLEGEQRELMQYASSLDIFNGLDVSDGLRHLFVDPCSVDARMVEVLITLWKTKANNRRFRNVYHKLKEPIKLGLT
ncbi:uncharacterized protein LOC144433189 [Glandiceps talaboti]